MAEITVREHIQAPPAEVFAVAADFAHAADRISGIVRVEMLTDGPVGVGTRFKETRVMLKREATEEMEVLTFDPPNSYVLGAESCGCRYRSEIRVTPSGDGSEITMTFDAEPLTFMAKVMSFVFRAMTKSLRKMIAKDFADLKASIEGTPTPSRNAPDARTA